MSLVARVFVTHIAKHVGGCRGEHWRRTLAVGSNSGAESHTVSADYAARACGRVILASSFFRQITWDATVISPGRAGIAEKAAQIPGFPDCRPKNIRFGG